MPHNCWIVGVGLGAAELSASRPSLTISQRVSNEFKPQPLGKKAPYLVPERVQEPDGINLQYWVYRPLRGLQVLEHIIREEFNNVDVRVYGRDSQLETRE